MSKKQAEKISTNKYIWVGKHGKSTLIKKQKASQNVVFGNKLESRFHS